MYCKVPFTKRCALFRVIFIKGYTVYVCVPLCVCAQVPRDVPGIDAAHLAMNTEDGVEVVWNEVRYSSRKAVSASKVSYMYIPSEGIG